MAAGAAAALALLGLSVVLRDACASGGTEQPPLYELGARWLGHPREVEHYWSAQQQLMNQTVEINSSYIYVLLPGPMLVVSKDASDRHSFLARGQPVLAAGNLHIWQNTMIWDNYSGHYQPGVASLATLSAFIIKNRLRNHTDHMFRVLKEVRYSAAEERAYRHFYQLTQAQLNRILSPWMPEWLQTLSIRFNPYYAHVETDRDGRRNLLYIPWPHPADP